MSLVEKIKALRSEITSKETLSQIIRISDIKDKYSCIDDLCILSLKYVICGYEHKAIRCYLYALAAFKSIKSKITIKKLILENKYAKASDKITVVGDFNKWDTNSIPMVHTNNGFIVEIPLIKGKEYQFRYFRNDHEYFNDNEYPQVCNGQGDKNMLLNI